MSKHENDGVTYAPSLGGRYKCKHCSKRYNTKEEEAEECEGE